MFLFGQSNTAVFTAPTPFSERRAFSEQRFQLAARVRASALVRVSCERQDQQPGQRLFVRGHVTLRGPQARLRFRQGSNGEVDERYEPDVVDSALLPAGSMLDVEPPQLPRRGGEFPLAWISFVDSAGTTLSPPICVGRARREPLHVEPLFEIPVFVTLWLSARRQLLKGVVLELAGELVFRDGLVLRTSIAPGCGSFGEPVIDGEYFDTPIAERGASLPLAQHRLPAPGRGRPLVSLQMQDWNGGAAGPELHVGWLSGGT